MLPFLNLLRHLNTVCLITLDHVINHRENLPLNTFPPQHALGGQIVEVGETIWICRLLARREDR